MATATTSSTNPFRTTPERSSSPSLPSVPPVVSVSSPSGAHARRDPLDLPDELEEPPPYTPSPDFHHGEETLEVGPRRPFQPPPARPPAQPDFTGHRPTQSVSAASSSPSIWRQLRQDIVSQFTAPSSTPNTGWSAYPGNDNQYRRPQQPMHTGASHSTSGLGLPPPPQRSSSARNRTPPSGPMSDFAHDFYAAGPQQGSRSAPSSPNPPYAPPPGPPHSAGGSSSTSDPPSSPTGGDGTPTSTPTPGHPLMRGGKVLVYPKGHLCDKCNNTGFKHADPSHPCKKCWNKHAKLFQGPLTYAFNNNNNNMSSTPISPSIAGSTLQRPLPNFRPPQRPRPPPPPPAPPAVSQFAPTGGAPAGPMNVRALSPWDLGGPPANAVVWHAGDPRLGGRLCWNCDGRGTVSLFIFDESTCGVCAGIGRIMH